MIKYILKSSGLGGRYFAAITRTSQSIFYTYTDNVSKARSFKNKEDAQETADLLSGGLGSGVQLVVMVAAPTTTYDVRPA